MFVSNHTDVIASLYCNCHIFFQITSATSFTLEADEVAVISIHLNLPVLGVTNDSSFVQVSKSIYQINVRE